MNLAVVGTGYVGLVQGACFAEMGNEVICVDIDQIKVENLKKGIIPIYEPGLEQIVKENYKRRTLHFTTSIEEAVQKSDIIFIAVGTPQGEDGSADLQHVLKVAESIGSFMAHPVLVVDKSTVPIGTADKVKEAIQKKLDERGENFEFHVISNPEFLKEGAAVEDCMKPDRIVIGADDEKAMNTMKELYRPFSMNLERFIGMDVRSAEMTKYAANSLLATKISFMNEIANICEKVGADVNLVRHGIGSDKRIGPHFIYPGCGYGGSCFPKDVIALEKIALENGVNPEILKAVQNVNERQKMVLVNKIKTYFGENLSGKTFAIWGLSFKPETDDMREASSITLIKNLLKSGAKIQAYDPKAMDEARHFYLKDDAVEYFEDRYSVLENADAVVLVTEWHEFRSPDFEKMKNLLKEPVMFDGRNQFKKDQMNKAGFAYFQIGVSSGDI
ncbi:MAG: UDP-glucose/GDP-mannose dehydrogenase family protein [Spirochaetia bacterium]|nr:UDP-glucose/GDP-mannose dehydrogenase family protein [Spirochaetia bacterium]